MKQYILPHGQFVGDEGHGGEVQDAHHHQHLTLLSRCCDDHNDYDYIHDDDDDNDEDGDHLCVEGISVEQVATLEPMCVRLPHSQAVLFTCILFFFSIIIIFVSIIISSSIYRTSA